MKSLYRLPSQLCHLCRHHSCRHCTASPSLPLSQLLDLRHHLSFTISTAYRLHRQVNLLSLFLFLPPFLLTYTMLFLYFLYQIFLFPMSLVLRFILQQLRKPIIELPSKITSPGATQSNSSIPYSMSAFSLVFLSKSLLPSDCLLFAF